MVSHQVFYDWDANALSDLSVIDMKRSEQDEVFHCIQQSNGEHGAAG